MYTDYSINPNAQFFTVLTRDNPKCHTVHIFVWSFTHWLRFNSDDQIKDIKLIGTGKSWAEAYDLISRHLPGYRINVKYCPKSFTWQ